MKYTLGEIASMINVTVSGDTDREISQVNIDSRLISFGADKAMFVAIKGNIVDGHDYASSAYDKGIRSFLVSKSVKLPSDASILMVSDTLLALQQLATIHRSKFTIPVIAITGSNGKTITKEWLSKLLSKTKKVVKSPRSYNSQIGVPISVLAMEKEDEIAVFEAGISQTNEMSRLQKIIAPTIGIFTNLGDAHSSGFVSSKAKFNEKALLFDECKSIIYNNNDSKLAQWMLERYSQKQLQAYSYTILGDGKVKFSFLEKTIDIPIPFQDEASIENCLSSISVMCLLGMNVENIISDVQLLDRVEMRMETKTGKWNSIVINDAYSSDLQSLENAIQHLSQINAQKPIIILSDLEENQSKEILYPQVASILSRIDHTLITIGKESECLGKLLDHEVVHYPTIDDLDIDRSMIQDKTILLKGARKYRFERLLKQISAQSHSATLEIDLSAMEHNLSIYASLLPPQTKIMTVLKASAYGSGAQELAKHLQHRQVAYMAVAQVDEGIQLREAGILTPILVLNPDLDQLEEMLTYNLEPEVYNIDQLNHIVSLNKKGSQKKFPPIHIKLDTGMHRLGFMENDLSNLLSILSSSSLRVASIFSHLAASDQDQQKAYTQRQLDAYDRMCKVIAQNLGYMPLRHIANTAAISRFPNTHYDMVRLGLGLYGIDSNPTISTKLERVHTFKAKIIQIKSIEKGESIGYNRTHVLDKDSTIAIINVGYADGLMRNSGNEKHQVLIQGKKAPIIGNVCMDLAIVDITANPLVKLGDEVEIFGKVVDINRLARVCNTIPYELLAGISPRVKKVYIRT